MQQLLQQLNKNFDREAMIFLAVVAGLLVFAVWWQRREDRETRRIEEGFYRDLEEARKSRKANPPAKQ